ncbi:hypothetical protein BH09VER1_BH09VER1_55620 [soil metagenome]
MKILSAILALFAASASEVSLVASPLFKLEVGKPDAFEAGYPDGRYSVVFEDDGDTGYLYALAYSKKEENPIQEAMSIYEVKNVTDRARLSQIVLVWTADSTRAALFINAYPHAVFDFARKRGFCRRDFPKPGKWGIDFKWDDSCIELLKK